MEYPNLQLEQQLAEQGFIRVAGMDEVGRGCLAGPVTIGVAIWSLSVDPPDGLRDSKMLSPKQRETLCPQLALQCEAWAVATASANEIDAYGIMSALGLAAARALRKMRPAPDVIILDGPLDYVSEAVLTRPVPQILPVVKADVSSVSVAAASVLAKVTRDQLMHLLHYKHPEYGWDSNVGYGSPKHLEAVRVHGATPLHRVTFRPLRGISAGKGMSDAPV